MSMELSELTGTEKAARQKKGQGSKAVSNAAATASAKQTTFDFEKDVNNTRNAKIIQQAATVVYREQKVRTSIILTESVN